MNGSMLALGSGLALLAGVMTAEAASPATGAGTAAAVDAGPVIQNSRAMAAADGLPKVTMRQQLTDQLTRSGFTNVTVTPSSFYIHAKNKQGDPVAMVVGPDGFTEVTEIPPKVAGAPAQPSMSGTTAPKQ